MTIDVRDTLSFIEDIGLIYCGEREIVLPMCGLNSMQTTDATVRFVSQLSEM